MTTQDEQNEPRFPPPPRLSLPADFPWRDIERIATLLEKLSTNVQNNTTVISKVYGVTPGSSGTVSGVSAGEFSVSSLVPLLQRKKWTHGHTNVATPGTAVPLPDFVIPPGFPLVIRARLTNTGDIYLGNDEGRASRDTEYVPLAAGESVSLKISTPALVYIDADVAGEGIVYFVET